MNEHTSFGILHTATLEADFTWWSTGINPSTRLLYHSTRQQLYNWRLQRRSPFPYAKLASLTQQTAERHYFQTKVSLQSLESKNYKLQPSMGICAMNNLSAWKEVINTTRSIWNTWKNQSHKAPSQSKPI